MALTTRPSQSPPPRPTPPPTRVILNRQSWDFLELGWLPTQPAAQPAREDHAVTKPHRYRPDAHESRTKGDERRVTDGSSRFYSNPHDCPQPGELPTLSPFRPVLLDSRCHRHGPHVAVRACPLACNDRVRRPGRSAHGPRPRRAQTSFGLENISTMGLWVKFHCFPLYTPRTGT